VTLIAAATVDAGRGDPSQTIKEIWSLLEVCLRRTAGVVDVVYVNIAT
jgi:hypothetical protein